MVGIKQLITFQSYWHVQCDCVKPDSQLVETSRAVLPPVSTALIRNK